jgi:hypothetical protein
MWTLPANAHLCWVRLLSRARKGSEANPKGSRLHYRTWSISQYLSPARCSSCGLSALQAGLRSFWGSFFTWVSNLIECMYNGLTVQYFFLRCRRLRFTSYRQFIMWIYHWLGRSIRVPLPSCVVTKIREMFPSENYVGFKYPDFTIWIIELELSTIIHIFTCISDKSISSIIIIKYSEAWIYQSPWDHQKNLIMREIRETPG